MPIRRMCCWQGCEATYQGDQPADWRHLLMFWSPRPVRAFVDIPDCVCSAAEEYPPTIDGRSVIGEIGINLFVKDAQSGGIGLAIASGDGFRCPIWDT